MRCNFTNRFQENQNNKYSEIAKGISEIFGNCQENSEISLKYYYKEMFLNKFIILAN